MARMVLTVVWFVLLLPLFGELSHGSEGGNQELVTLTVNATCEANASLTEKDLTFNDKIIVTISERSTYRVVATDGAFWQLEFVGTKNSISVIGGGKFTTPGGSASWSYSTNTPTIPTALANVGIDGKLGHPGTGTLSLNNFVGQLRIEANHDAAMPLAREIANMAAGFATSNVQADIAGIPSNEHFHKGLAFSFDPNATRITASGQATYQFPFKQGNQGGTGTVNVSYHVASVSPELEAVLLPKGEYATWLPEASSRGPEIPGNTLSFDVELRDGGKQSEKTAQFEIRLENVSRYPGASMNSPWTGGLPDLQLVRGSNPALVEINEEGQHGKTSTGLKNTSFTISSFDGGAAGQITVLAHIDGEETVLSAHLDGKADVFEVVIPVDKNDNGIADAWEKENGVWDQSPDVDEDVEPPGDRHQGDGLTIWEEYRGFFEDGKHIRTDPRAKDLFICDTVSGRVKQGIDRFAALTKLAVHDKLTLAELSPSRIVNRNTLGDWHVVDQHGLLLDSVETEEFYGMAMGGPGTPKSIESVLIDRALPDTVSRKLGNGTKVTYDMNASIVAHELLHACNVWHHGEGDDIVYWQAETVDGKIRIVEYAQPEDSGHPERGKIIKVCHEAGGEYPATSPFWKKLRSIDLGKRQGPHSGNDDCIMRYSIANAYSNDGYNLRYCLIWDLQEPVGTNLCRLPGGTGVNQSGRLPLSRYGDAAAGRGGCIHALCVNDAYH